MTGHVCWHNCVIWDSEHLREHAEHEQDSPKVNMWFILTQERAISKFSSLMITSLQAIHS
jgi:hypothetical protein